MSAMEAPQSAPWLLGYKTGPWVGFADSTVKVFGPVDFMEEEIIATVDEIIRRMTNG